MLRLAGRLFDVECENPIDYAHLVGFFGDTDHTRGFADCRVMVGPVTRPAGPATSTNWPLERWEVDGRVTLWHADGRGAIVAPHNIVIGPAAPEDHRRSRTIRQLLTDALSLWFGHRGELVAHGAVVGRGGRSLLVVGPTGAGKSSAAIAALGAGLDVYTDDLAVVRSSRLECDGIAKPIMVEQSLARDLDDSVRMSTPEDTDARNRVELSRDVLESGTTTVAAVVAIDHSDGAASLERLDHATALSAVSVSSYEAGHGDITNVFPIIARLAALPSWRLAHDADPSLRVSRAARLLTDLFDEVER